MEQNDDLDQGDEMMLPGFRFHPTDEELVTFYLRRKVQQRPLSIELIKQLDIYKFDPWDLPKMAAIGEREWYFYCPRDRKYRNSNRPNRVTSAGFWKATGTDRPIYSSDGTKCVGLKKSLVFYKGRAAKGTKTDWMMHEFRLPPFTVSSPSKKPIDKDLLPNDSWAICRIFKKITVRQRASPRMWAPSMMDTTVESNYSYINFNTDITEPQEIIANVYTSPSSTNSFSSHITTGNHNINGFQYLNYEQSTNMAFGSCGLGHAKSIPFSLPARSISLPNLEFSDTSTATATDPSHCNHTSAVKSPQMHPIEDSDPKTHHQVSLDPHPGGWIDHHQQEAEALLENTNMSGSIIPPCVLLSQSDLYDVLKSVTAGPWDTPTPNIL